MKKRFIVTAVAFIVFLVVLIFGLIKTKNYYYQKGYFFNVPGLVKSDSNYALKVAPIQKYKYTIAGKTDEKVVPLTDFPNPYSVNFNEAVSGEQLTINIVGDIIPHGDIQLSAYLNKNYNEGKFAGYDWLFRNLNEDLKSTDITIGNLETPSDDQIKFTGTLKGFNVSSMIIGALKGAGFDILLTANNHAMDEGPKAYFQTIQNILRYQLIPLGYMNDENVYTSEKGISLNKGILEYKGFRLGVLNYTFLLNKKESNLNGLNYCVDTDFEIISRRIGEIKQQGAEFVILFLHWGREYFRSPDLKQKDIAKVLFDSGADAIIGGHSHYIQPMEIIKDSQGREKYIAYSLGNFISHQRGGCKYGMRLKLTLVKNEKEIRIKKVEPFIIKTEIAVQEYIYKGMAYTFNVYSLLSSTIEEFLKYRNTIF